VSKPRCRAPSTPSRPPTGDINAPQPSTMLPRAAVAGARCRSPDRCCRCCARIQHRQRRCSSPAPAPPALQTPEQPPTERLPRLAQAHSAQAGPAAALRCCCCCLLLLLLSSRCSRPQTAALTPRAHEIDAEKADQPRREARDEMGSRGDSANRLLKAMGDHTHARGSFTPYPGREM
jgi:hypothetical protein